MSQLANILEANKAVTPTDDTSAGLTGVNIHNIHNAQLELEEKRDEASIGDKLEGMLNTAKEANIVMSIGNYMMYFAQNGDVEDKKFKESFTFDNALDLSLTLGMGAEEAEQLNEAVSKKHLDRMLAGYRLRQRNREFSNSVNSQWETIAGSLVGSIVDVNIPVAGWAYKVAKTTQSTMKGFGVGMAVDTAIDSAYAYVSEDYNAFDVAVNTPISVLFNAGAVRKAGRETEELLFAEQNKIRTKELLKQEAKTNRENFFKKQNEIEKEKFVQDSAERVRIKAEADKARAKELHELELEEKKLTEEANDLKLKQRLEDKKARAKEAEARELELKEKNKKLQQIQKRLDFFRKQDKIEAKAKKNKKDKVPKEVTLKLEQEKKAMEYVKDNLEEAFDVARKDIKNAYKKMIGSTNFQVQKMKQDIDELVDIISRVDNTKGQILKAEIKKQTGKNKPAPLLTGNILADGRVLLKNKNGKAIGKVSLSLMATAGIASANDGTDFEVHDGVLALMVLGGAGIGAKHILKQKNLTGLKDILGASIQKVKDISSIGSKRVKNSNISSEIDRIVEDDKLMFFGFYDTLKKAGQTKLADDLFFDFKDTISSSAEKIKDRLFRGKLSEFAMKEQELFVSYLAEKNITTLNPFRRHRELVKFRGEVTDAIEGSYKGNSTSVKSMANDVTRIFKETKAEAIEAGVFEAGTKEIKNYLPRYWRNSNIQDLVARTDKAGKQSIINAIAKAILNKQKNKNSKVAMATAETMVDRFVSGGYGRHSSYGDAEVADILEKLKSKFPDIDEKEIAEVFIKEGDQLGRFKHRIAMDLEELDGITIKLDGIETTLTKDSFLERNMFNVMERYLNEMTGSIALAEKGYYTEKQIRDIIDRLPEEVRRVANIGVDSILGRPTIIDPTSNSNQIASTLRNLAVTQSMPLITISTMPEFFRVSAKALVSREGFRQYVTELKGLLSKFDADDNFINELSKISGRGQNLTAHDLSIRGMDGLYNDIEGIGLAEKTTATMRDLSIKYFGLPKATDFYERVIMATSYEALGKIVNGGRISAKKLAQYGLDEKKINILKPYMEISPKGNLKKVEIDNMSKEAKRVLGEVIDNMVNAEIQRSSLGGTPVLFFESGLGKMFGTLMGFGLNAYSNLGLRGLYNRDLSTFMHSGTWFAGAYAGVVARDKIYDRELDEEDRIVRALLNMPSAGVIGATGVLHSPAMDMGRKISDVLDFYNK